MSWTFWNLWSVHCFLFFGVRCFLLFEDSVLFDISPITIVLYVKLLMALEKCFRMQLWVKRVYIKQLCSSLGVCWAQGKGWWMYVSQAWPAGVDWLQRPRLRPRFWSFCNTMVLKMELASCTEKHFESLSMCTTTEVNLVLLMYHLYLYHLPCALIYSCHGRSLRGLCPWTWRSWRSHSV